MLSPGQKPLWLDSIYCAQLAAEPLLFSFLLDKVPAKHPSLGVNSAGGRRSGRTVWIRRENADQMLDKSAP